MKRFGAIFLSVLLTFSLLATNVFAATDNDLDMSENKTAITVQCEQPDGTVAADPENYGVTAIGTDNYDGTATATVSYDDLDGVLSFRGWYDANGNLLSTEPQYTFDNTGAINETNVIAKMYNRNVLFGAAGFEGFASGDSLRVNPPKSGVLPTGYLWGMYSDYSSPNYEGSNEGTSGKINAVVGSQKVNILTSLSKDADGNAVGSFSEYTVTPHSGDTMISTNLVYRSLVRKIDNLKPNTTYTFSMYVNNPDKYTFVRGVVVGDTYNLPAQSANGNFTNYGSFHEVCEAAEAGNSKKLVDDSMVRQWKKISFDFTTGDENFAYVSFFVEKSLNGANCGAIHLDDMVCVEKEIFNRGNAIRSYDSALRYKFSIPNEFVEGFGTATTEKIGVLVIDDEVLGDEELVIDGEYTEEGKPPINAEVTENNYQYVAGDNANTYFTVALYNIGKIGNRMNYEKYGNNYSVRPYIIYGGEDGKSLIIYGDTVSASIFDVMFEIKKQATSDEDMAIVDNLLNNEYIYNAYMAQQNTDEWYLDVSHATDYDYSMAVVGDIQITTEYHPDELHKMYDWILENKDSKKINYAFSLGDLTNNNSDAEWVTAETQLKRVQDAGIGHSLIRGNHDWSYASKITYDEYGDGAVSYDGTMQSYYKLTTIGGVKYMMLTLNIFPTDDEVAWAKAACEQYSDYNVILSTHAYLSYDSGVFEIGKENTLNWGFEKDPKYNYGQEIYDKLVSQCSNIVMVLCGHDCLPDNSIGRIDSTRADGSTVVQLMIDHQNMETATGESQNMLAMLYFSNGGKNVRLEYFSANNGVYYMAKNQMDITLDLVG